MTKKEHEPDWSLRAWAGRRGQYNSSDRALLECSPMLWSSLPSFGGGPARFILHDFTMSVSIRACRQPYFVPPKFEAWNAWTRLRIDATGRSPRITASSNIDIFTNLWPISLNNLQPESAGGRVYFDRFCLGGGLRHVRMPTRRNDRANVSGSKRVSKAMSCPP